MDKTSKNPTPVLNWITSQLPTKYVAVKLKLFRMSVLKSAEANWLELSENQDAEKAQLPGRWLIFWVPMAM